MFQTSFFVVDVILVIVWSIGKLYNGFQLISKFDPSLKYLEQFFIFQFGLIM